MGGQHGVSALFHDGWRPPHGAKRAGGLLLRRPGQRVGGHQGHDASRAAELSQQEKHRLHRKNDAALGPAGQIPHCEVQRPSCEKGRRGRQIPTLGLRNAWLRPAVHRRHWKVNGRPVQVKAGY